MSCKCGGTDIEYNHSRGDSTCMSCGAVLSENQIVTELGFVQDAAGSNSMVGQFVPANGSTQLGAGARQQGSSLMFGTESREVTLSRGRVKIQQIAMSLQMTRHHIDAAHRLFMLAVQHNFIQGRKTDHVVAACLYIVCRREKTQHLLIDFSDVLQANVYILGKTFMKFIRVLNISMPIIDPSLFVHRFASRLEFEDKTHLVAMTALRLVSRMCRDWMSIGRRPAGICGASLIIAARLHGFRRSQKEVGRVVKICEATLRKRVMEFIETPSSEQTVAEFNVSADDFAEEMDPPCFKKDAQDACAAIGEEELELEKDVQKDIDDEMDEALNSSEMRNLENEFSPGCMTSKSKCPQPPPPVAASGGVPAPLSTRGVGLENQTDPNTDGNDGSVTVTVDENGKTVTEESISDSSDDEEVSRMVLSHAEQECKERIWLDINREYLQEQEIKRKWEEDQIAMGIEPESIKRRKRKAKAAEGAKTPAEATMNALSNNRVSSKINYDVLKNLFDPSSLTDNTSNPSSSADVAPHDVAADEDFIDDNDFVDNDEHDTDLVHEEYDDDNEPAGDYFDDD